VQELDCDEDRRPDTIMSRLLLFAVLDTRSEEDNTIKLVQKYEEAMEDAVETLDWSDPSVSLAWVSLRMRFGDFENIACAMSRQERALRNCCVAMKMNFSIEFEDINRILYLRVRSREDTHDLFSSWNLPGHWGQRSLIFPDLAGYQCCGCVCREVTTRRERSSNEGA
jgi:hypothetical protein